MCPIHASNGTGRGSPLPATHVDCMLRTCQSPVAGCLQQGAGAGVPGGAAEGGHGFEEDFPSLLSGAEEGRCGFEEDFPSLHALRILPTARHGGSCL